MSTKNRSTGERRSKSGGRALPLPQQSDLCSGMEPNGHHEMILPRHDSALTPSVEFVESVVKLLWLPFFRPALLCPHCGAFQAAHPIPAFPLFRVFSEAHEWASLVLF